MATPLPLDMWSHLDSPYLKKCLNSCYQTRSNLCLALSLTHSHLVNLIDVTLACEDANSKLVDVASVADVDVKDRVGNSLLQF